MTRKIYYILIILIFLFTILSAQQYSFIHYTAEDGLAQAQVNSIAQSSDGYLWFGTYDGISRFDGQTFINFSSRHGLSNNLIYKIHALDSGLFIIHLNGSVTIYNLKSRQFSTLYIAPDIHQFRGAPSTIDPRGHVWFSPSDSLLLHYTGKILNKINLWSIKPELKHSGVKITSLAFFNDKLLIGTNIGYFIYDPAARKIIRGIIDKKYNLKEIITISRDRNHNIWILTRKKIFLFVPQSEQFILVKFNNLTGDINPIFLYHDSRGFYWLSTANRGVFLLEWDENRNLFRIIENFNESNGFSIARSIVIMEDREGNLWFGTNSRGAYKFPGTVYNLYTRRDGLLGDVVYSVSQDRYGRLWVGDNNGLIVFRKINGKLTSIEYRIDDIRGQFGDYISRIIQAPDGSMWCATRGNGIYIYDPETFKRKHIKADDLDAIRLYDLIPFGRYILVGTDGSGVIRIDYKSLTIDKLPGTEQLFVTEIYKDKAGNLWLGTFGSGLFLYKEGNLQPIHLFQSNHPVSVTSISEDNFSRLWVGTLDNGLFIKDDHRIYQLDRTNGLSGNSVFFTYCDSSQSYIGTSGGLDIISTETLEIDHQNRSEGYMGSECNLHAILKDDQGYFWMGTVNGLVRFAKRLKLKSKKIVDLSPEIESVRLLPDDILIRSGEQIPADKYSLIFQFHAIHFTSPEAVKYSYRLIGLDNSWSPLNPQKSVTFSKLPPGKYKFQVRYTIDNGVHFSPIASFDFQIGAPFWSRLEFILGIIFLLFLMFFLYYVLKRRKLEKEKARLEEEIAKKTHSLQLERDKLTETLKQLRESEDKFKNLTESTSAGIFIYQGEKFKYVNPAAEEITGYSSAELQNMKFWEVVHPDYRELVRKRGIARQKGKKVKGKYQFKIIRKDGEIRWVEFTSRAIAYNGKPAAIGTAIDITEKMQNMRKIQEALTSYQYLFENNMDLVYIQDLEGRFLEVNSEVIRAYGYSRKEIIGKTPEFLADPERLDKEEFAKIYQNVLKGVPQKFEFWAKRKNGSIFPKEVIWFKGKYFGEDVLIAVARDISDRKQFEDSLYEEKEKFETTLSGISESVITLTSDFKISYCNQAAEHLLGDNLKNLENQEFHQVVKFYRPGSKQTLQFNQLIGLGQVSLQHFDFRLINLKGQEFLVQIEIKPLKKSDQAGGYVVVLRDVTERRAYEEELSRAEKLEALGKLASGLAHDINNILTVLYGNLQLIGKIADPAKLKTVARRSMESFDRLKGLIEQLQTFARGGAPVRKAVDVKSFLQHNVYFILSGSNIKVEIDVQDNLFPMKVDPEQMYRVFHNLILNAKEAMKDKGKIIIKAENFIVTNDSSDGLHPGRYVRFHIIDNGPGIPQEIKDKIFDPFFSTKKEGRGLGLSVSYSIVRRHQGQLKIASSDENGTHFIMYLPATTPESEEQIYYPGQESRESQDQSRTPGDSSHKKGRILVMDDVPELTEFLKDTLETMGYEVHLSASGEEAIRKVKDLREQNLRYDLVILDLTVPGGMGGREALKKIREIDPQVKAIVSSGYTDDDTMANYRKYGFDAYLKKPYRIELLSELLEKLLQQQEQN